MTERELLALLTAIILPSVPRRQSDGLFDASIPLEKRVSAAVREARAILEATAPPAPPVSKRKK